MDSSLQIDQRPGGDVVVVDDHRLVLAVIPSERVLESSSHRVTVLLPDDVVVSFHQIISTPMWAASSWEPSEIMNAHSTIQRFGGRWYGAIGTGPLPEGVEFLPYGSDERIAALEAFWRSEADRSLALVREALGSVLADRGTARGGELTFWFVADGSAVGF